jgi:cell division septation protein DedD
MIDDTVLVVDADHETEENIVATLEAEGYLVFTASGRDINAEMAKKITPSLIYLRPTSGTIEGFDVCKAIHKIEKFKNVPIVLLASLKGPLDPRYTSFYGIVDYLKLPVSAEELVSKTKEVRGSMSHDLGETEKEEGYSEKAVPAEKLSMAMDEYVSNAGADETAGIGQSGESDVGFDEADVAVPGGLSAVSGPSAEAAGVDEDSEIGQPSEDYSYRDVQEKLKDNLGTKGMRRRPGQHDLFIPVAAVIAAILVVAGGFLAYRFFSSPAEKKVPLAVKPVQQVQQQQAAVPPLPITQKKEEPVTVTKPAETKEVPQKAIAPIAETKPAEAKKGAQKAIAPIAETQAAVEATQKASAAKPESKPAGKPGYSVQLGAFKSESSADALVKTYKGKGYEAFTLKGTTKEKATVYRVLVGRFENKKEALQLEGRIRTKEKAGTIVFRGELD